MARIGAEFVQKVAAERPDCLSMGTVGTRESGHSQSREGPGARSKPPDLKAKSLQHTDVQVAERRRIARIEGQMLSVLEAAAGQQNWEILHIVVAGVP